MDLGPHAAYIWSSYGAVAIVLCALVVRLWLEGRRYSRDLAALERQGHGRGELEDRSPGS